MDYEKKYKDALEWIESIYSELSHEQQMEAEAFFHELKESEDERIRKQLIHALHGDVLDMEETTKAISWLEKQGEHKLTDKIEPKFHEGEWITCEELNTALIVNIVDDKYEVEFVDGNKGFPHIDYVDRLFHLWTIKDAKDGDVLQLGNVTAIFQEYIGSGNCKCYCSVYNGEFEIPSQDNSYGCHNAIPATKEQRDTLFAKMKEAGYEWNADKKELKKIEQKPQRMISAEAKEAMYDKPTDNDMVESLRTEYGKGKADVIAEMEKLAWSEADSDFMYDTLSNLTEIKYRYGEGYGNVGKCIDWLKSLKQRIGG